MKKIGKLTINQEKIMSNEELLNLRGGYTCVCKKYGESTVVGKIKYVSSISNIASRCQELYGVSNAACY